MWEPWRRLALAAAIVLTVGVGRGAAQTVLVRNLPPGATVDVIFNSATVASGAGGPNGDLTLTLNRPGADVETDVHVFLDLCEKLRRVILVERGLQPPPPPEGTCQRREMVGLFIVRKTTAFVVDVTPSKPALWLRQGPVPREWLIDRPESEESTRTWRPLPKGVVLFGGGTLTLASGTMARACGDSTDCSIKGTKFGFTAGMDLWLTRYIAAEASYYQPARMTASGSGTNYQFNSFFEPRVISLMGRVGIPAGPVRIFGGGGMNYHRATVSTTQTTNTVTVTDENGTTFTFPGATQTIDMRTGGWGYVFGGGMEVWVTPAVAIYGEFDVLQLKGSTGGTYPYTIKDRVTSVAAGIRVHIGRSAIRGGQ